MEDKNDEIVEEVKITISKMEYEQLKKIEEIYRELSKENIELKDGIFKLLKKL